MKLALVTIIVCIGHMASAAQIINSAWLNLDKQVIEMEVTYSGGCEDTQLIKLNVDHCSRSNPMTCVATLQTSSKDSCRAVINEMVEVPAADYLNDETLKQLVILDGDKNPTIIDFSDLRI